MGDQVIKPTSKSTGVLITERSLKRKISSLCWNKLMDDAETTLSSSAFQILAAATGKARLPVVDSLKNDIKR